MRLEDILFWMLWVELVQVSSKLLVELTELLLRDDLVQVIVFCLIRGPLSS